MGGFPQLPSSYNPYVGEAAQFATGAAHAYNAVQEAKRQQAIMAQRKAAQQATQDQTAFMNQLRLHSAGAMPADVTQPVMTDPKLDTAGSGMFGVPIISDAEAPRDTGLKKRTANPAIPANAQGQYVRDPSSGQTSYLPTAGEKTTMGLNDSNSFVAAPGSDTEKFLQETANIKPGTRIPFSHVAGITGLANEMQKAADTQAKRKQTGKVTQTLHDSLLDVGLDVPVGADIPYERMDSMVKAGQKPKEPKKTLHWEQSTDDRGTIHLRSFDEDGLLASEHSYPGEGKATKQPKEAGEKPVSRTALVGIEKTKSTALANAYKAYKKATSDPLADDDAKASAAADLKSAYQDAQNAYEAELTAATGHDIEHDDWADRMGGGADQTPETPAEQGVSPTAPAQPAQTSAAPAQAKPKRAPVGPPKSGAGPPPDVVKGLGPGVHTFGNGQTWMKKRDGSMMYLGGGQ